MERVNSLASVACLLFLVFKTEVWKEALPLFESEMATVGKGWILDCRYVHVGRELSFAWFVFF